MAGVSIGDVLALINLTRQIATSIRSCTTAEEDYKSTTAHLDFILHIAETIRDAAAHGTQQDEHLRRYLEAFEDPIQRFLERMRKCEPLVQETESVGRRRMIQRFCRRGSKRVKWALVVKDDAAKLQASLLPQFTALTMYMQARTLARTQNEGKIEEKDVLCEHAELSAIESAVKQQNAAAKVLAPTALAIRVSVAGVKLDLVADSKGVMQSLEVFLTLLMDVWKLLHLFFLTSAILPRGPSMLLDTNIQIQDALGRAISLPFEQCASWKGLIGFLDLAFKDCPGRLKVQHRNFGFLTKGSSLPLNYANWDVAIRSGLKITMVMYIQRCGLMDGTCPNCGIAHYVDDATEWSSCKSCKVTYNVRPARPLPQTTEEEIEELNESEYEYLSEAESQERLDLEERDTSAFKHVQWFEYPCSVCSLWTPDMFVEDGKEVEITCKRCCTLHLF